MKKTFKKAVVCLAAALSAGTIATTTAECASIQTTNVKLGQNSFDSSWHTVWDFQCGDIYMGSMTVGFGTFATDEDYVQLFGTLNGNHYASVKNSDGDNEYTNTAAPGVSTGKADVKHTGVPVTYYAFWDI